MWDTVIGLLSNESVQVALSAILVGVIALATRRFWWVRHIAGMALAAYEYAEEQGIALGLKGTAKLKSFMDRFRADFQQKFGREPSPQDRADAVKTMEKQVQKEHSGAAALGGS